MNRIEEIEDFYGVYLLVSKSAIPSFAGRTYVGYTVDPNRRIKQHNRGQDAGGARKTSNRGPWIMVMIIHGFPNNISALRFEWAWQQPRVSRRLKQIPEIQKKLRTESYFEYNFRILSEMLRIGPWNRLPLTIRWLVDEYHREFEVGKIPPLHMPICFGRIKKVNRKKKTESSGVKKARPPKTKGTESNPSKKGKIVINYDFDEYDLLVMGNQKFGDDVQDDDAMRTSQPITTGPVSEGDLVISSDSESDNDVVEEASQTSVKSCTLCRQLLDELEFETRGLLILRCLQPRCRLLCHPECLAALLLEPGQYVPVEGDCPICETHFLWGDIIRKANGCTDLVDDLDNVDPFEVNEVSDEEE
ncbi:structure-specific endonuclease subunit SLX1 homolog [Anopheles nili]|uniref:structure-specific endonuclease subunit SLX1 homolog n=1 Tax=Anopheles nili TaxID=185578 RepID=UPI00237B5E24|nr:structure-specific endonuclease subunit SLX1 homolog [Anopheles nili]